MMNIGIVEGFFGPVWSHESRLSYAPFLAQYGGSFYIYAPKRDANLRKEWREEWGEKFLTEMRTLRDAFHQENLKYGVAISPFGLGSKISQDDWNLLRQKFMQLSELKIDYLGLFFDDMPSTDDLLRVQTQVVKLALEFFPSGLIFCPSYYTFDPILDKVFGQRPVGYVEGLKTAIPANVDVCWTGPKVISEEISRQHLVEVEALLGRKPFIWENLFANDGPRNCKFLKLKNFAGRDGSLLSHTSGVAFNLMNQPYLSQILYLSSLWVMEKSLTPEDAYAQSCLELCTPEVAHFLVHNRALLMDVGMEKMAEEVKTSLLNDLANENSPVALEIKDWLKGDYLVGPECLTD